MKAGWGTYIFILYSGFVLFMLGMVGLSIRQKVELVSPDYYELELKYQEKIDQKNRSLALQEPLRWELLGNSLRLTFPGEFRGESVSGKIHLMRPSDVSLDEEIVLEADTSLQRSISFSGIRPGVYELEIEWSVAGKTYNEEGIITLK